MNAVQMCEEAGATYTEQSYEENIMTQEEAEKIIADATVELKILTENHISMFALDLCLTHYTKLSDEENISKYKQLIAKFKTVKTIISTSPEVIIALDYANHNIFKV